MAQPAREHIGSQTFRYGFNGAEYDAEAKPGSKNHYDLGARMFDPRTGRMFSTDPRESDYAWQSPYAYFSNRPTSQVDINGEGGAHDKYKRTTTSVTSRESQLAMGRMLIYTSSSLTVEYYNESEGNSVHSSPEITISTEVKTTTLFRSAITGKFVSFTDISKTSKKIKAEDFKNEGYSSFIESINTELSAAHNTLVLSGYVAEYGLQSAGKFMMNSLKEYKFGNNLKWYGTEYGHYHGTNPPAIRQGRKLLSASRGLGYVNQGLGVAGYGFIWYDYKKNPNYGIGFGGKGVELGADLAFNTASFTQSGFWVSAGYFARFKPALKAQTADERYLASFSPYDGALRGARDAARKQEAHERLRNAIRDMFND